jgi:hypothetical protein
MYNIFEPFQRTDISTQPLGPTNYTGSYTSSKNAIAAVIGAWCHKQEEEERWWNYLILDIIE